MLQTTIRDLLNKSIDTTGYRLYLVKGDSDTVLYVGQTTNFSQRLRGHITTRDNAGGSILGRAIYENMPHSDMWIVELYTIDECLGLIKKWFPKSSIVSRDTLTYPGNIPPAIVRYAEDALTHEFVPLLNRTLNLGYQVNSPFLERLHSEKAEEERWWKEQVAKKREYLINSVCDVCGEHDTWVDVHGELSGVLEGYDGFKLLCRDCKHILNLMDDLRRNSDRVRKIEAAIAARSIAVSN